MHHTESQTEIIDFTAESFSFATLCDSRSVRRTKSCLSPCAEEWTAPPTRPALLNFEFFAASWGSPLLPKWNASWDVRCSRGRIESLAASGDLRWSEKSSTEHWCLVGTQWTIIPTSKCSDLSRFWGTSLRQQGGRPSSCCSSRSHSYSHNSLSAQSTVKTWIIARCLVLPFGFLPFHSCWFKWQIFKYKPFIRII